MRGVAGAMGAAVVACVALAGCGPRSAEYYTSRPYSGASAAVAPPLAAAAGPDGRAASPAIGTGLPTPEAAVVVAPGGNRSRPDADRNREEWARGQAERNRRRQALDLYQRDRLAHPGLPPAPFRGAEPGLPVTPFIGATPLPGATSGPL